MFRLSALSIMAAVPVLAQMVSPTANPLVFLYTSSNCSPGSQLSVIIQASSPTTLRGTSTPTQSCAGGTQSIYLAGLRAKTSYTATQVIRGASGTVTYGTSITFTTGSVQGIVPAMKVTLAPQPGASAEKILLQDYVGSTQGVPVPAATDTAGNIVWYYNPNTPQAVQLPRPLPGGTFLTVLGLQYQLQEIDLGWKVLRSTTTDKVNAQLAVRGVTPIAGFNHETIRLPNGCTAVIASNEKLLTNVQGPGTVDVVGNEILVLDQDFNVVWTWDAFDWLDPHRSAILGELCTPTAQGCPPLRLASSGNDWLHSNSLYYDPRDGNLVVSVRHQDWVIKIAYQNGSGSGRVVWRLGPNGDFTMLNSAGYKLPWFTHSHDAEFEPLAPPYGSGVGVLSIFDNGNTRRASDPTATSRGQTLLVNETNMTADVLLNADLGVYSPGFGSAQRLANGNYHFLCGAAVGAPSYYSRNVEINPTTLVPQYVSLAGGATYRSFRMNSIYGN